MTAPDDEIKRLRTRCAECDCGDGDCTWIASGPAEEYEECIRPALCPIHLAPDAVARLVKLADQLDQNATNAERMVALLQPEFDAFLARSGHNVYVVRDYVDHQSAAKRQRQEALDIRAALAAMEASPCPAAGGTESV